MSQYNKEGWTRRTTILAAIAVYASFTLYQNVQYQAEVIDFPSSEAPAEEPGVAPDHSGSSPDVQQEPQHDDGIQHDERPHDEWTEPEHPEPEHDGSHDAAPERHPDEHVDDWERDRWEEERRREMEEWERERWEEEEQWRRDWEEERNREREQWEQDRWEEEEQWHHDERYLGPPDREPWNDEWHGAPHDKEPYWEDGREWRDEWEHKDEWRDEWDDHEEEWDKHDFVEDEWYEDEEPWRPAAHDEEHWCFAADGSKTHVREECDPDQGQHFRSHMVRPMHHEPMHRPGVRPDAGEHFPGIMGNAKDHLRGAAVSADVQPIVDAVINLLETLEAQFKLSGEDPNAEVIENLLKALKGVNQVMENDNGEMHRDDYGDRREHFEKRVDNVREELDMMFEMAGMLVNEAAARGISLNDEALNAFENAKNARDATDRLCDEEEDCKKVFKEVFKHFRIMEKAVMRQVEIDPDLDALVNEVFADHMDHDESDDEWPVE